MQDINARLIFVKCMYTTEMMAIKLTQHLLFFNQYLKKNVVTLNSSYRAIESIQIDVFNRPIRL